MKVRSPPPNLLNAALIRLLRPLVRIMLRHSIPFSAFEELAKRAYVEVATNEFAIPGKKPSVSRASILTGLTRKDVQRLLSVGSESGEVQEGRYNRAARVLTGWIRDPDFLDAKGHPLALAMDGEAGFAELVRRHSGDVPPRAVLDELLRVGAVVQRRNGQLVPVVRAYVPQRGAEEKLHILGTDVAGLIDTIDHNLQHGDSDPRFQRKVSYRSIALEHTPEFRRLSAKLSQSLLEELDRWLAKRDTVAPDDYGVPRARIGLGIYYMEERLEDSKSPGEEP